MSRFDERLKFVTNDYSSKEKQWHLGVWLVGLVLINLPFYNLTVGPFVTANGTLLMASLYSLPLNMVLFYGNVALIKVVLTKRPSLYLIYCALLVLAISALETFVDLLIFNFAVASLDSGILGEIALGNVLLNLFLFLIPSWLFGFWRILTDKQNQEPQVQANLHEKVWIPEGKKQHAIEPDEWLYVKSEGNYCDLVGKERTLTIRISLSALLALLPSSFVQCHKSYLVNTHHISRTTYNHIFVDEVSLPLGRKYAEPIREWDKSGKLAL